MSKITKITIVVFVLIIFFHKKFVSYYYLNKLSNWVERPLTVDRINFNYSGYVEIKGIKIMNSNKHYFKNIFEADTIVVKFDTRSLFTDLIIVNKLNIIKPIFFLDILIVNSNQNKNTKTIVYDDNIGLAKKINEKPPAKIWPQKDKDINFLVRESEISEAKGNIKVSTISKPSEIRLSKMKFSSFGNDKYVRHYKDILNSILYDLYARTKEAELKKTLKEIYKF
tara:strand:+ start:387 stop:1061 length:675 start_codon:yes stop_codon:yes gene_type:complete